MYELWVSIIIAAVLVLVVLFFFPCGPTWSHVREPFSNQSSGPIFMDRTCTTVFRLDKDGKLMAMGATQGHPPKGVQVGDGQRLEYGNCNEADRFELVNKF